MIHPIPKMTVSTDKLPDIYRFQIQKVILEHESRKIAKSGSVASRVKSVRVLKKFIEKVLSQKQDHNDVDLENIDIDIHELDDIDIDNLHLYDELDGYGISGQFFNI